MAYLDEVNKQNPHVVLILQLEGSGLITKSEARKNLRRVLSEDFIWDEPVTVYPPSRDVPWPGVLGTSTLTINTPK